MAKTLEQIIFLKESLEQLYKKFQPKGSGSGGYVEVNIMKVVNKLYQVHYMICLMKMKMLKKKSLFLIQI